MLRLARAQGAFRHPREMGPVDVEGFLTTLTIEKGVAPAGAQAYSGRTDGARGSDAALAQDANRGSAGRPARRHWHSPLSSAGLAMKEVHFEHRAIIVRSGKGEKDCVRFKPPQSASSCPSRIPRTIPVGSGAAAKCR